jgi:uncharacterized Tic20 family protein
MGMKENTFCMLLHLSQLLIFASPVLGLVAPIVLWTINKDKYPIVDQHGKIIFNWLISCFIYTLASIVLVFIGIGVVAIPAVLVAAIAFPIIGGLKANDGIVWEYKVFNYPVSIRFLK